MKTSLTIEGMSCEHCVKSVTEALEGVEGVEKAKVTLKHKKAVVYHADSVSVDAIKSAVTEAGFSAV
ncbi:MAG: cation transporter [Spirochaetaceae bacterium]|jgi:copper ion binding protein|nr:cation transporter [Spirochaetaceae bacterium]